MLCQSHTHHNVCHICGSYDPRALTFSHSSSPGIYDVRFYAKLINGTKQYLLQAPSKEEEEEGGEREEEAGLEEGEFADNNQERREAKGSFSPPSPEWREQLYISLKGGEEWLYIYFFMQPRG